MDPLVMTPYTYECEYGHQLELRYPMGEAPRSVECPFEDGPVVVFHDARRVFNGALQFTYGKDNFHGQTIKERQERQIAECAADGRQIEPIGSRWV